MTASTELQRFIRSWCEPLQTLVSYLCFLLTVLETNGEQDTGQAEERPVITDSLSLPSVIKAISSLDLGESQPQDCIRFRIVYPTHNVQSKPLLAVLDLR